MNALEAQPSADLPGARLLPAAPARDALHVVRSDDARVAPGPSNELVVLKFGSSVLRDEADLPRVVSEIYRWRRAGRRVLAVVSALHGETDRLFDMARRLGSDTDCAQLPRLVAQGEERSAALLAIACDRAGLEPCVMGPRELGLVGEGPAQSAKPVGLDHNAVNSALENHDVVIAPGYVAVDARGRPVLLGRGGSDLSAVFLGGELEAGCVRLVKDVDGVYDRDPAKAGGAALRFDALSYDRAREVAGKLVQPQAIDHAERLGVAIEVSCLNAQDATRIDAKGGGAVKAPKADSPRVALAGCGVVGGGVLARLQRAGDDFEVCAVLARDPSKPRDPQPDPALFVQDLNALFDAGPDIVVDVLSSGELGEALISEALERGVSVVSANKQALLNDAARQAERFERSGVSLAYSAAVGGGAPMVETVRNARDHGTLAGVEAVLNGTVNYLLDRLGAGESYEDALADAQRAGFAEEDPSADVDGRDAVAKALILASEAYGASPDDCDVHSEALDDDVLARISETPGRWRQLSTVAPGVDGRVQIDVAFRRMDGDPFFAGLEGERNALRAVCVDGAEFSARGRGAGRTPTAESVFADLVDWRAKGEGA